MNSARYWLERGKELERLTDQGCRVTAAELAKLYEQALASIRERIRRLYRRFAEGYGVTPGEAQELLSVAQTKQEREILRRMLEECDDPDLRAEILKKLDAPAYGYRISRLEALQDQVYFDAKAVGVREVKYDRGRLLDTYKTAYYRTTFNLSQSVGHNVPFERISDRRAARAIEQYWTPDPESLGQNFSQRVWNNTTELAENVREIVTEGLLTGGNYKDMADRLQAQMGDVSAQKVIQPDGSARTVLTGSGAKYRATRLIRTEGNHITGQAVMESYEDAGIEKYIYRSLLELRTCKRCGKLDGKRFPVKEQQVGVNMHPMHPNCRCFVVPDEPDEDLKDFTRSAQTGADNWEEVPANMSWEEWRKKYVEGNPQMKGAARPKKKGEKTQESLAKSGESGILKSKGQSAGGIQTPAGDKPKRVGLIENPDKETVVSKMEEVEERLVQSPVEMNCTVTGSGEIWLTRGSAGAVHPEQITDLHGISLQGSYSYHNHPENETRYSFSDDDVAFFFEHRQQWSMASDSLYKYVMERLPETKQVTWQEARTLFQDGYAIAREKAFYQEPGFDIDRDGFHVAMEHVSRALQFRYERVRKNDK